MPPTLILVRHAQALHNETQDYSIHDPDLTELGQNQCVDLRKSLMENPLTQEAGLIVVSPMRRTIQTALRSVDWLLEKGIPIQADASWQENSAKPCDTGSSIAALTKEFDSIDFTSALDPVYPDKTSPAGAAYHYTRKALLARGQAALQRLYQRPEKVIIVVSHSGFLRLAVTGCYYFNADYRVFNFVQPGEEQAGQGKGEVQIVQDPSTKESGGGLGWSFTEQVVLGSDLPDELPPAAA
ncbi:putative phosphoglycerate mutase protein [Eutypa lata UCREL1]|uniref:Putative phosphoglycerate mutase protein n=1 Tax=Eutypa lata (strain UCR-EL1) TaxID=1287681 RepID=M7T5X9_EUTLA|nr:putative phosphoglycerate mutase protein [Eutypa lata UCREL1]